MSCYNYPKSFFFPKEDGNISLQTIQQRIGQALSSLQSSEDYIELDDGTKCFTKNELENALFHSQPTETKCTDRKLSIKQLDNKQIIILSVAVVFIALSILNFFSNGKLGEPWMFLIGCAFTIYMLTKKEICNSWRKPFIFFLSASASCLLGELFFLLHVFFLFRLLNAIACILMAVGCKMLSSRIENRYIFSCSIVTIFLFSLCSIFWLLATIGNTEIYQPFMLAHKYFIEAAYLLLGAYILWIGLGKENLLSERSNKYSKLARISILVSAALCSCIITYSWLELYSGHNYESSHIKESNINFEQALESGRIYYGMTYNEIAAICGPGKNIYKQDGIIQDAQWGRFRAYFRGGIFDSYTERDIY